MNEIILGNNGEQQFNLGKSKSQFAKERFLEIGTTPIVSPYELVETCFDKYKMYELLNEMHIPTGKCYVDKNLFYEAKKNFDDHFGRLLWRGERCILPAGGFRRLSDLQGLPGRSVHARAQAGRRLPWRPQHSRIRRGCAA